MNGKSIDEQLKTLVDNIYPVQDKSIMNSSNISIKIY